MGERSLGLKGFRVKRFLGLKDFRVKDFRVKRF